jgi:hypothetical protein
MQKNLKKSSVVIQNTRSNESIFVCVEIFEKNSQSNDIIVIFSMTPISLQIWIDYQILI